MSKWSSSTTSKAYQALNGKQEKWLRFWNVDTHTSSQYPTDNRQPCRHNRSHLKPICYDDISFQDHPVTPKQPEEEADSFQDHHWKPNVYLSDRQHGHPLQPGTTTTTTTRTHSTQITILLTPIISLHIKRIFSVARIYSFQRIFTCTKVKTPFRASSSQSISSLPLCNKQQTAKTM